MADNTQLNPGTGGDVIATDDIAGVKHQLVKVEFGEDGAATQVSATNRLPVADQHSQPITDAQLRAASVPVSGPLTDAQLRTTPVATAPNISRGAGVVDSNTQRITVASDEPLMSSLGAQADDAASSDTGSFSIIAFIKRALQNWTTLLSRTPALGQAAMAASSPVVIASDQSTIAVNQSGVSSSGSINSLNGTVALSLTGASGWSVDLRGTWTATVTFQGTIDGTNWFTIAILPAGGGTSVATVTTATANGQWWGNATGLQQVRAIATAFTTGPITVTLRAMQAAGIVTALVSGATTVPVSGTVTANIGTGSIAAGTNAIGDVGIQYRANATGAGTLTNILCPGTPSAQQIRSGAGRLISIVATNTNAAARWIKIFNLLGASVTPGTTSALSEIAIPPNQVIEFRLEGGVAFSTGITIMITGAQGLTNNTAVTSGDVTGFTIHA